MKKLIVLLLCFFATNAFASSADSGRCPWKMPFMIVIEANGIEHDFGDDYGKYDTTYPTTYILFDTMVVDTISAVSFIAPDTIMAGSAGDQTEFIFAPKTDSIISITYQKNYIVGDTADFGGQEQSVYGTYIFVFRIKSLLFDDASIYSADFGFSSHYTSLLAYDSNFYYEQNLSSGYRVASFTASSVTLSGIFRPTTFSDPASIVTEAPQPNNLAIYSSNGSIACSFDISDHARNLEIYSPLGIREAIFTIQPGQTEASLPHLPAGFYFVRLEGSMAKVYIAE
jgi:hypothetical protein